MTCFKSIFVVLTVLDRRISFTFCGEQITRGHPFKLRLQHHRIGARKYFFSSRTNCRPRFLMWSWSCVCCKASLVRMF